MRHQYFLPFLLLALLTTAACTPKAADVPAEEGPVTTVHPPSPGDDHVVATPVAGLGSAIPNDFGAAMYAPSADVTAEQILSSIRDAHPGKALYLDLWAVWCMPCIGEFPASKALHAETAGLPVEFVYLCTSSKGTQARWESIVKSKEIPGTHVFVDRLTHSKIMQSFRSNFYPFYAIVKPDGTSERDVKRPSQLNRAKMERLIQ
ncbi:hypothetical protein [Lewinella sp. 4G2]|uniref:TlpA family protein disulfide reductase n=1 Tax=Lewinella sp. 4G2 TaxID=1803372 RepID=UPI0007B4BA8A|nr:hypothetical protein [Lewinella sp. 4G2]OAV44149.1 hypothetical protein A3850_006395 [Lewinella sp. 4G2]